jgi:hypothetical protein
VVENLLVQLKFDVQDQYLKIIQVFGHFSKNIIVSLLLGKHYVCNLTQKLKSSIGNTSNEQEPL